MKRLADLLMVLLFAVMLSACGRQSEESYAGQSESPKSTEQIETSETVTEGPSVDAESEDSSLADAEDTQIKEGNDSVVNDITFNLETKTVMLNSGYEMPVYGLGTYSLTGETCVDSVTTALDNGVRLIDTAYMYHNEESVGETVRNSGIPREEIFVITKLYPSQFDHPETAIEEALGKLDIEYAGRSERRSGRY